MATASAQKQYFEGVGRRKTAVARVRLTEAAKPAFSINERALDEYFPTEAQQKLATEIFTKNIVPQKFAVSAHIKGSGIEAQAEALRHGIARAMLKFDPEVRSQLKAAGYLTRDDRMKERRKFGLKKARRAPQWSKR